MSTPQQHDDDPRAPMTIVVGAFGAILVFVIILALQTLFVNAQESERQIKTFGPPEELSKLRAGQLERLNTYRWVDASKGVASIPIDRAMELVVRDQGRNPMVPVRTAATGTAPSAAGATSATPATPVIPVIPTRASPAGATPGPGAAGEGGRQ